MAIMDRLTGEMQYDCDHRWMTLYASGRPFIQRCALCEAQKVMPPGKPLDTDAPASAFDANGCAVEDSLAYAVARAAVGAVLPGLYRDLIDRQGAADEIAFAFVSQYRHTDSIGDIVKWAIFRAILTVPPEIEG